MSSSANTTSSTVTMPITTGTTPQNMGLGGVLGSITPMLLILVAFYFLLMRPQQKREAKRRAMISSVKRGDKVVTNGGFIGTIHKVISEREVSLEISEGVRVRILKGSISDILDKSSNLGKDDSENDISEEKSNKSMQKSAQKKVNQQNAISKKGQTQKKNK